MKEKLIELLGLRPGKDAAEVTDQAVIDAVVSLQREAAAETNARKADLAISALVRESHGALSREGAKQVLADRAIAEAKTEKAAKK